MNVTEWLIDQYGSNAFRCRCGVCGFGIERIELEAQRGLMIVTLLRGQVEITSAVRCIVHNEAVGGAGGSRHLMPDPRSGLTRVADAFDIRPENGILNAETAAKLVDAARAAGFRGIGLRLHGPMEKRHVHMDMRKYSKLWTYA